MCSDLRRLLGSEHVHELPHDSPYNHDASRQTLGPQLATSTDLGRTIGTSKS